MKVRWVLLLVLGLLAGSPAASAADGTFLGRVVDPPANERAVPGWIFVEGKNQMLRRVEVAHAQIAFGEDVPVSQRRKCNAECLSPGRKFALRPSRFGWRVAGKTGRNPKAHGQIVCQNPTRPELYQTLPNF